MKLLFGVVVVVLLIVPSINVSALDDGQCFWSADYSYNPNTGQNNDVCPLMSGPNICVYDCDFYVNGN